MITPYEIIVTLVAVLAIAGWAEDHRRLVEQISRAQEQFELQRRATVEGFKETRERSPSFFGNTKGG